MPTPSSGSWAGAPSPIYPCCSAHPLHPEAASPPVIGLEVHAAATLPPNYRCCSVGDISMSCGYIGRCKNITRSSFRQPAPIGTIGIGWMTSAWPNRWTLFFRFSPVTHRRAFQCSSRALLLPLPPLPESAALCPSRLRLHPSVPVLRQETFSGRKYFRSAGGHDPITHP